MRPDSTPRVRLSQSALATLAVAHMNRRLWLPRRLGDWIVNRDMANAIREGRERDATDEPAVDVARVALMLDAYAEAVAAGNAMLFAGWKLLLLVESYGDELPDEIVEAAIDFRAVSAEFDYDLPSLESEEA